MILFQLEDSFQVVRGMIVHGFSADLARNWKGVYDRAQPILQLGLVLSTGFSLALIPMITAARVKQDIRGLKRSVWLAVKITLLVAGAETVGLIVIMRPLNQMLFQTAAGTIELQLFMPAVLLSSLIVMFASILQGFGKLYIPVISILIGIVVKWLANQFLIPRLGIAGASIATCLGLLIILGCCYLALKQTLPFAFITKRHSPA
ncbi:Probable cell division protein ytgP [Listeria grayi]|uniref:Probable cell division protein ytgP n=1 Tax=Listeria grayi TaxID=1641 RepID=A0A378MHA4_LISGR|nr:Probable cell division protein ytgP [Listeria grayi]